MKNDRVLVFVNKKSYDSLCSAVLLTFAYKDLKIRSVDKIDYDETLEKTAYHLGFNSEKENIDFVCVGINFDDRTAETIDMQIGPRAAIFDNKIFNNINRTKYPWVHLGEFYADGTYDSNTKVVYDYLTSRGLLKSRIPALESFVKQVDDEVRFKNTGTAIHIEDLYNGMNNSNEFYKLLYRRLKFNIIRGERFKLNKDDELLIDEEARLLREYSKNF